MIRQRWFDLETVVLNDGMNFLIKTLELSGSIEPYMRLENGNRKSIVLWAVVFHLLTCLVRRKYTKLVIFQLAEVTIRFFSPFNRSPWSKDLKTPMRWTWMMIIFMMQVSTPSKSWRSITSWFTLRFGIWYPLRALIFNFLCCWLSLICYFAMYLSSPRSHNTCCCSTASSQCSISTD